MSFSPHSKIIKVFYSYASDARKDKNSFTLLTKYLSSFKDQESIEERYNSEIGAGQEWRQVINSYIASADIIVLLISVEFLTSKYYREVEMKRVFERYKAGTVRVLSVLLRPTDQSMLPLQNAVLLPTNGKPISRWQDKDEAFLNVARGIRKVVEELASHLKRPVQNPRFPLWTVPHWHNIFFTGRDDIFCALHSHFSTSSDVAPDNTLIQLLTGLDGIGKTQIAIEYAYRYKQEYQAVLWIRADSQDLFRADVAGLADLLALDTEKYTDEQTLFSAVQQWLHQTPGWLLILDNIDDFALLQLIVPPQSRGHVLLTTHAQATGMLTYAIAVPPLPLDEGTLFLLRRAKCIGAQAPKEAVSLVDYTQAQLIVQEFDGFPLALDQAGAYIEETQSNLTMYLALYRQRRAILLHQRRGQFPESHPQSVTATLSLAFEQVARINPVASDLLDLMAFLHPDAIPTEMITKHSFDQDSPLKIFSDDPFAFNDAIAALLAFSLIRRRADTTMLGIHRIVQTVLQESLPAEKQQYWARCTIYLVSRAFPHVEFETWPTCARYFPQAQRCAEQIEHWHFVFPEAAELLYHLGSYCDARAFYGDAERYLTLALKMREQLLGPEHIDTARCLNALALLYGQQSRYTDAEAFQGQALALYEQLLGPNHPETAPILNNLAWLYQEQGKLSLVEELYQRVLAIYEAAYGSVDAEVATTLNNLGWLYQDQGRYADAEPFYQRALALREELLQAGHPDLAQSLNNLGMLYRDLERYEQAEPLLLRALEIREQVFGPDHPDVALSLNNLACIYYAQERYEQAEALYQRATTIFEQTLGADHPNTALGLNNLASLYLHRGDIAEAEPLYCRALAIYEQVYGSEHCDVALCLQHLAEVKTQQGLYQEAETLYQRALSIDTQVLGPQHPDLAIIMGKYASLLDLLERGEEALRLRHTAHAIQEHTIQ